MNELSETTYSKQKEFTDGLRDGIPIALGYFAVSFSFGILGSLNGLTWWETTLISMANVTSAGQFAGLEVMAAMGSLLEMAMTQFVINLRYALMSISLTQKVDSKFKGLWRLLFGFMVTDEIFAVSYGRDHEVSRMYFFGLCLLPFFGWSGGTLCGALMGAVLPNLVVTSLGIALYGMFIAIFVPAAKKDRKILFVVAISILLSVFLRLCTSLSSGFSVIICAILASLAGALFFPVETYEEG